MVSAALISIIIPTRNRRALLQETIASLQAQRCENWELIVVNDASEDDTAAFLDGLDEPRLQAIHLAEHGERTRARNIGLQEAHGEFVLFLDDDDLLPEDALGLHLQALRRYPEAIASIGSHEVFDVHGARKRERVVHRLTLRHIWYDVLFGFAPVSGQTLYRTACLRQVGGWDETYAIAEDHQLNLRIMRLGPAVLLPDIVLRYRVHENQWRPINTWKLTMDIRKRAIKRLPLAEKPRARAIYSARKLLKSAILHSREGEPFKAIAVFWQIFRTAPEMLRSPVMRPVLLREFGKCFLGGEAGFQRMLRLLRIPQVDTSQLRRVESDGRVHRTSTAGAVE